MNEHDVGGVRRQRRAALSRCVRGGKKTGEWVAFDPTGKPLRTTKHREVP
ncbi:MAG TPA: hypothetical protein VIO80_09735 [Candidatus Dormibacteraeota bacterium]|jgi:hypothetical protein